MTFFRLLLLSTLLGATAIAAPGPGPGGQRGPRAGQQGPRHSGQRAGPDREARFLQAMERQDPVRHARIVEVRDGHPGLYKHLIMGSASMLKGQQRDPEARELFSSIVDEVHGLHTLLGELDPLPEKQKTKRRGEVETRIGTIFELRQKVRERRLLALEERVKKMRDQHDRRASQKDKIVDDFTDKVLFPGTGDL